MKTTIRAPKKPVPRKTQVEVFFRDHWLCRYCGEPVFFAPALRYLQIEVDPDGSKGLAYWRLHYDRYGAPLLDELAAVVDHVEPQSVGGPGTINNLVTACNKCNDKKNNSASWAKNNKRKRIRSVYGEPVNWDGLASVFLHLAVKYEKKLTQTEKEWERLLNTKFAGNLATPKVDLTLSPA